jgi:hypothetical protein
MRLSHDGSGHDLGFPFTWPLLDSGEDFSRPADLPQKRGWKVFSVDPIRSPVVIAYPTRSRSIEISYSSEDGLDAYWGVWLNTGGWATHHHFAVEPTTGRFDQLDRAVKDGSAGMVDAAGQVNWSVTWQLR